MKIYIMIRWDHIWCEYNALLRLLTNIVTINLDLFSAFVKARIPKNEHCDLIITVLGY